jgi:sugar phosphate isomerase/epimerase
MMSAASSTLGLPGASIEAVAETAANHGFSGVELRTGGDEAVHVGLTASQRRHARRCLSEEGIQPLAIASYVKVVDADADDSAVAAEAIAHLQLAHDLGAPYLRVFPGGARSRSSTPLDDARAGRRLAAAAGAAAPLGVQVALETHDSHGSAARARSLLDQPGCNDVMAIWDVLHTWLAQEDAARSRTLLGDRLAYVQVKDVPSRTDLTPVPPGDGALPLGDVAAALSRTAYQGWVSWEYELAWNPEQPALNVHGTAVRRLIEAWGHR